MSTRGAAAVIVGLVLAIGLIFGLVPHSVPAEFGAVSCGSAFNPDKLSVSGANIVAAMSGSATDFDQQCSDALSTPRLIALGLIGVGALTLLFVGLTRKPALASQVSV
jgi:hypothetical protein